MRFIGCCLIEKPHFNLQFKLCVGTPDDRMKRSVSSVKLSIEMSIRKLNSNNYKSSKLAFFFSSKCLLLLMFVEIKMRNGINGKILSCVWVIINQCTGKFFTSDCILMVEYGSIFLSGSILWHLFDGHINSLNKISTSTSTWVLSQFEIIVIIIRNW